LYQAKYIYGVISPSEIEKHQLVITKIEVKNYEGGGEKSRGAAPPSHNILSNISNPFISLDFFSNKQSVEKKINVYLSDLRICIFDGLIKQIIDYLSLEPFQRVEPLPKPIEVEPRFGPCHTPHQMSKNRRGSMRLYLNSFKINTIKIHVDYVPYFIKPSEKNISYNPFVFSDLKITLSEYIYDDSSTRIDVNELGKILLRNWKSCLKSKSVIKSFGLIKPYYNISGKFIELIVGMIFMSGHDTRKKTILNDFMNVLFEESARIKGTASLSLSNIYKSIFN
jgi:hypothetical protein